jgi:Lectin C-type domain
MTSHKIDRKRSSSRRRMAPLLARLMMRITLAIALCCPAVQAVPRSDRLRRTMGGSPSKGKSGDRAAPTETPSAGTDSAARTATTGLRPRPALLNPQQPECVDADGAPLTVNFHNGHVYSYVPTMTFESWHGARAAAAVLRCCHTQGHLLVVSDPTEREFVRTLVVPHGASAWVGLVDDANDGVWEDGKGPRRTSSTSSTRPSSLTSSDQDSPTTDCGPDSSSYYDDKDYLHGVLCRESVQLPIVVEFDCPNLE